MPDTVADMFYSMPSQLHDIVHNVSEAQVHLDNMLSGSAISLI